MCKNKTFFHFVLAKNKPVESTDREVGLPDATSTEVSSQNTKEGSGSKAEKRKFQVFVAHYLWLVMFAEWQDQILLAKPNLLLERKSLNVKVLFIIIKVRKMKNVSIYGISKSPFLNL
jgi:uncharacterized membrane protein